MKNKLVVTALLSVMAIIVCSTAYAMGGENCPVHSFFGAIGGFLYNALPWNWGNWMGQ